MVEFWKSLNSKMPWKKHPKHDTIGNLQILEDKKSVLEISAVGLDPKEYDAITKKDPKFNIMVYCIDLALRLLEYDAGRNALV